MAICEYCGCSPGIKEHEGTHNFKGHLVCERAYKLLRKNRMKRAIRAFVKEWKD